MKIKIKDLLYAKGALIKVFNKPMKDVKLAYTLTKIQKKIDKEFEDYEESRKKVILSFVKKDKDGNPKFKNDKEYDISDKELTELTEEANKLGDTEIELDIWKIPFKVLEDAELSISEMTSIVDFVEEPEEEINEDVSKEKTGSKVEPKDQK